VLEEAAKSSFKATMNGRGDVSNVLSERNRVKMSGEKNLLSTAKSDVLSTEMEGYLEKLKRDKKRFSLSSWNRRYFWLDPRSCQLLYYKNKKNSKSKKPSGGFRLEDIESVNFHEMEALSSKQFSIRTKERVYVLRTKTVREFYKWTEVFREWCFRGRGGGHSGSKENGGRGAFNGNKNGKENILINVDPSSSRESPVKKRFDVDGCIEQKIDGAEIAEQQNNSPSNSLSTVSCLSTPPTSPESDFSAQWTSSDLDNINHCDGLEFGEPECSKKDVARVLNISSLSKSPIVPRDTENQLIDQTLEDLKRESEKCLAQLANGVAAVKTTGKAPPSNSVKRSKPPSRFEFIQEWQKSKTNALAATKSKKKPANPPPPPRQKRAASSSARTILMNLNKSPGTTSKMVDRASQSLFIDVETCDAEREEKYDSDSNSEKCLTPVQKFDVSPVLDDDETSLEWDHMKGKKKDCSSPHSTASIESKYDEDAYANGCDEVNEEVWLVDKDTWDSSSDEDDECEGNKTEEGIAAPAAAPTVDHSSWDSSDEDEEDNDDPYEQKTSQ
jgi:hypothetical protein